MQVNSNPRRRLGTFLTVIGGFSFAVLSPLVALWAMGQTSLAKVSYGMLIPAAIYLVFMGLSGFVFGFGIGMVRRENLQR